jgi:hypothetical protein
VASSSDAAAPLVGETAEQVSERVVALVAGCQLVEPVGGARWGAPVAAPQVQVLAALSQLAVQVWAPALPVQREPPSERAVRALPLPAVLRP